MYKKSNEFNSTFGWDKINTRDTRKREIRRKRGALSRNHNGIAANQVKGRHS